MNSIGYRPSLMIDSMSDASVEASADIVVSLIEAMIAVNRQLMQRWIIPSLYSADVTYDDSGTESWKDALAVLRTGKGSCQDLVAWRVSELRETGEDARVHVVFYQLKETDLFHIVVMRPSGQEDPSTQVRVPGLVRA